MAAGKLYVSHTISSIYMLVVLVQNILQYDCDCAMFSQSSVCTTCSLKATEKSLVAAVVEMAKIN